MFHHVGQDDCHWPGCTCAIYEAADEDTDTKAVTPAKSDAYTYTTDPRLIALRHPHTPTDFGQPEPEPDLSMWGWAW